MGSRTRIAAVLLAAFLVTVSATARAEDPAFALTVGPAVRAGTVGGERQFGGVLSFDVWYPRGPLRLGASTGIVSLFGKDELTRTFAPLGPTFGFSLRFRGGLWAGVTDEGLRMGTMLTGGLFLHYRIEERISLALGVDTLFTFGHGDISLFAPSLSLVFSPRSEPDAP